MTREPYVTVEDVIGDLPLLEAGEMSDVPEHEARNHRQSTVESYDGLDVGEVPHAGYSPRRLPSDEPSYTVTVSQGKSPIHPIEPRMLSVRELCRLQSLPDSFVLIASSRTEKMRLVGNAVPVDLAQAVVGELP